VGVLPELVKGRVVVRGEVNRGVNVISLAETLAKPTCRSLR
jgi:hypothetical protein